MDNYQKPNAKSNKEPVNHQQSFNNNNTMDRKPHIMYKPRGWQVEVTAASIK